MTDVGETAYFHRILYVLQTQKMIKKTLSTKCLKVKVS